MKYAYTSSPQTVADYLTEVIASHLEKGQKVTWLITGGSGMVIERLVADALSNHDVSNLSVMLTDERYGKPGHGDENWQQLLDAGFTLPGAQLHRVLTGDDRQTTTKLFGEKLHQLLDQTDYSVGLFGIGPDGHTAGIKPDSPAVKSEGYAADFAGDDFERITMTPPAIARLNEAVIAAFGEAKFPTLARLINENIPPNDQPAQFLKLVDKCTLFTDLKEEKS